MRKYISEDDQEISETIQLKIIVLTRGYTYCKKKKNLMQKFINLL